MRCDRCSIQKHFWCWCGNSTVTKVQVYLQLVTKSSQVYLQQNKKKAEAKGKKCHAKTMWSPEKPILKLVTWPFFFRI